MIDIVSVLSERLKQLRFLRVKRTQAIEKFIKLAEETWQKSKYSYVISSMKTQLLQIALYIDESLQAIDKLGYFVAACNDVSALFSLDKTVNLDQQDNYICIQEVPTADIYAEIPPYLIKQRSDKWKEIRSMAKVTGSTMHKALVH